MMGQTGEGAPQSVLFAGELCGRESYRLHSEAVVGIRLLAARMVQ